MPQTALESRMRETIALFDEIYDQETQQSVFSVGGSSLLAEVDASSGAFKPGALAIPGSPVEFNGSVPVNTPETVSIEYYTKVFVFGFGIDINLLMRTDKIARNTLSNRMRNVIRKWVGHRDQRATALMLTYESTGNLAGGAFFSSTTALPGGNTFDNIVSAAVGDSATEVLSFLHSARAKFRSMKGVGGNLVRTTLPRIGLMYSPLQAGLEGYVMDALRPMLLNDKYKFEASEVIPMPNAYITARKDLWAWDLDNPEKPFVVGVEQPPMFETNAGISDTYKLLNRRTIAVTSYAYEVAPGNAMSGVLGNDT